MRPCCHTHLEVRPARNGGQRGHEAADGRHRRRTGERESGAKQPAWAQTTRGMAGMDGCMLPLAQTLPKIVPTQRCAPVTAVLPMMGAETMAAEMAALRV